MIYLSLLLPGFNIRVAVIYVFIFIIFGGRSILPKIAWQKFPNWQKVSIQDVVKKIEDEIGKNSAVETVVLKDINLERDAKLMLQSSTTDLFVDPNLAIYNFRWIEGENKIIVSKK